VLEAGESFSGCSVHFVDDDYDHGPVILQQRVAVDAKDTVDDLAQRVFDAEKIAYPRALELVLSGEVKFERR
jgi:phosphoribosylglycinamide formyltransferase-1